MAKRPTFWERVKSMRPTGNVVPNNGAKAISRAGQGINAKSSEKK